MKKSICFISVLLITTSITAQQKDFPELTGPYLSQKPPRMIPELFAPGIILTGYHEHSSPAFSPDGKEIYWSEFIHNHSIQIILYIKVENGIRTPPQVAPFSGQYSDGCAVFSIDGNTMFLYSNRPVKYV